MFIDLFYSYNNENGIIPMMIYKKEEIVVRPSPLYIYDNMIYCFFLKELYL